MDNYEVLRTGLSIEEARRLYPAKSNPEGEPRPLISSSFSLQGEWLKPDACTDAVGIKPTSTSTSRIKKGTWLPSGEPHITPPYWALEIRDQRSYEINDCMVQLLDQLWPWRRMLMEFIRQDGIEAAFTTSVQIFVDRPVYSFTPTVLERLAYFDAEWGLDIFDYSESA